MKILINGLNSKVGGGKSILNNYLKLLIEKSDTDIYYLVCPDENEYKKFESTRLKIIRIDKFWKKTALSPILYLIILPNLINKFKINSIFNLGDIPIYTKTKQIYLFDWPYAVYPEYMSLKWMDFKGLIYRKIKFLFFKKLVNLPTHVIAQTETMKKRLGLLYNLDNITIVPNAVSLDNFVGGEIKNYNLSQNKNKLLYLTHYYTHKNIEILIPVAKHFKKFNLPFVIIITISPHQHQRANKLIKLIKNHKLESNIINVGPVEMKHVPSLYSQCDGLLMPTLLESFSGTYVESMYHNKPIFTSNYDFAIDVCRNTAFYFNPLDSSSIIETIENAFNNFDEIKLKTSKANKRLNEMPNWRHTFLSYQKLIKN